MDAYRNWDREAAVRRALLHADASGASVDGGRFVWNFAFGSNLSPGKVRSRGMQPVKVLRGVLLGWRLLFNHTGGYGTIEAVEVIKKLGLDLSLLSRSSAQPVEVHGDRSQIRTTSLPPSSQAPAAAPDLVS